MTDFNERQLEELLQTSLPETSLTDDLSGINPFGAAIGKIITGMVMTTITLEFLCLNYILPTVGIMLIYLGMRTLRKVNRWFTAGWIAALFKLILTSLHMVLQVTPYVSLMAGWGLWAGQAVHMVFLACLGFGIQKAGCDAGLEKPKMPTWPVILWQAVLIVLALAEVSGWAVMILMLYAWVKMVKHISHCADDLEQAGYSVPVSPVWFSAKPLLVAYLVLLLAVMTGASLLVNYTPVDSTALDRDGLTGASAEAAELREVLTEKGFPEDVLETILDEDLADLGGPEDILAVDGLFEDNNTTNTERMDGWSVSVQTADGRIKNFVWFTYADGKHAGLVDSVKIQYEENQKNYSPTGRIFWEKKGEAFMAEPVMKETENTYLWFGDITTSAYYTSKYSFPPFAKNPYGYFTWWTEETDGSPAVWSMNNTHFHCLRTPLVLPYMELPDNPNGVVLFGGFGSKMGQEKFQIYATPRFTAD